VYCRYIGALCPTLEREKDAENVSGKLLRDRKKESSDTTNWNCPLFEMRAFRCGGSKGLCKYFGELCMC